MYMYPFIISFLTRFKLFIRISFSSISIRPLLDTLPYTLYNTIECRVEYLIREASKLRFEKEEIIMINLTLLKMKGIELVLQINKIMKKISVVCQIHCLKRRYTAVLQAVPCLRASNISLSSSLGGSTTVHPNPPRRTVDKPYVVKQCLCLTDTHFIRL